ncbi:MAG: hypothetical protein O3C40_37465 [Planctomycetota bacterium]|nr:hypothetical protein [Planctomycetota bacterium]
MTNRNHAVLSRGSGVDNISELRYIRHPAECSRREMQDPAYGVHDGESQGGATLLVEATLIVYTFQRNSLNLKLLALLT